jgi:uncharacterized protein YjbJ (UPF0337 family)
MQFAAKGAEISGDSKTRQESGPMKGSTKTRLRGKLRQAKGKAKQKLGRAARNTRLEGEGIDDQVVGKIQDVGGRIQKKLEE